MPYFTPNAPPGTFVCRRIMIPNDLTWLELVNGALSELLYRFNFVQEDGIPVDATVEAFTEMFYGYTNSGCEEVSVPIGAVIAFAGTSLPSGYLLCDGSAVSRSTYAGLFELVGETYGAGDGSTTFNLPDIRSRFIVGSGTGTGLSTHLNGNLGGGERVSLAVSELPAHQHGLTRATGAAGGNFHLTMNNGITVTPDADMTGSIGSNQSHQNMPPYFAQTWIIRAL